MKSKVVRPAIATWWKLCNWKREIEPLRIIAFTEHTVTYQGYPGERRQRRDDIFPSFEEAKAEAVRRATRNVESAKDNLQRGRSALGQWESLKEPAEQRAEGAK